MMSFPGSTSLSSSEKAIEKAKNKEIVEIEKKKSDLLLPQQLQQHLETYKDDDVLREVLDRYLTNYKYMKYCEKSKTILRVDRNENGTWNYGSYYPLNIRGIGIKPLKTKHIYFQSHVASRDCPTGLTIYAEEDKVNSDEYHITGLKLDYENRRMHFDDRLNIKSFIDHLGFGESDLHLEKMRCRIYLSNICEAMKLPPRRETEFRWPNNTKNKTESSEEDCNILARNFDEPKQIWSYCKINYTVEPVTLVKEIDDIFSRTRSFGIF